MPNNDEFKYIAKHSNIAVIGIAESKLDNCILDFQICILDNYQILHCDRKRKDGRIVCYVTNDLSYIEKEFLPEEIENTFFEILLPKTKPITVGIIYCPPKQNNFLQTLNGNFTKFYTFLVTSMCTCIKIKIIKMQKQYSCASNSFS